VYSNVHLGNMLIKSHIYVKTVTKVALHALALVYNNAIHVKNPMTD